MSATGLNVSHTLAERVRMWQSPWDNAVAGGDQVAQAIWAHRDRRTVRHRPRPRRRLAICRRATPISCSRPSARSSAPRACWSSALAYGVVAWRGFRVSLSASNDYGFFLATALTLFLIVPVLVMAAGVMGITPLTGVVTPFLSYGGSAMAANCAALGMLCSIHADRRPAADLTPFRAPMRWLVTALAASAAVLVAVLINIQVVHADEYVVKPHLGVQADGGRRYAYNPRVLDLVRQLPRGTVYDRKGLPLATGDPACRRRRASGVSAARRLARAGVSESVRTMLSAGRPRLSPARGRADARELERAQHVVCRARLGEQIARLRRSSDDDADDRLVGPPDVDDSARLSRSRAAVAPPLRAGSSRLSWRCSIKPHDVRLTIDAGLQLRVTSIVASYARKSAGRAAAVVLDPDTGELLASASYPWPDDGTPDGDAESGDAASDSLLDRARYGLYPPGSTFKLVTAAAALRQGVDPGATTFACIAAAGRQGRRQDQRLESTDSG